MLLGLINFTGDKQVFGGLFVNAAMVMDYRTQKSESRSRDSVFEKSSACNAYSTIIINFKLVPE